MRYTNVKTHNLTKNEIIVVVPNSLQCSKKTLKILEKLQEVGFIVIPMLNEDLKNPTLESKTGLGYAIMIYPDTPASKTFAFVISQDTDDRMREKIEVICENKFGSEVKYDLYIEEKFGSVWCKEDFVQ